MADNPKPDDKGVTAADVISGKTTAAMAAAKMNKKFPHADKKFTVADVKRWVARVRKALKNV